MLYNHIALINRLEKDINSPKIKQNASILWDVNELLKQAEFEENPNLKKIETKRKKLIIKAEAA